LHSDIAVFYESNWNFLAHKEAAVVSDFLGMNQNILDVLCVPDLVIVGLFSLTCIWLYVVMQSGFFMMEVCNVDMLDILLMRCVMSKVVCMSA
jgi:hypothetical protein